MTWGPIGGGGGGGTSSATYTVTDALIVGAATTSGVRLDVSSGTLRVREGDNSDNGFIYANQVYGANAVRSGTSATGASPVAMLYNLGVITRSGLHYLWSNSASSADQPADTGLARASAGVVAVKETTNNSATNIHQITASSGTLSGASYSFSAALPAGAIILGVTVRVTTTITGATSFDVGDGSDVDRYGAAVALASGTTTTFASATANPLEWRSANGDVVLTANGSNFTGGVVRICVHYMTGTAPTS